MALEQDQGAVGTLFRRSSTSEDEHEVRKQLVKKWTSCAPGHAVAGRPGRRWRGRLNDVPEEPMTPRPLFIPSPDPPRA